MRIPLITKYLEEKNMEYQNALLEKQVQEVQNIYLTMRGWRHDYHNHLQAMKAYVKMGEYDRLEEYLGLLEQDLDHVNQLIETGNVNLDAILNSKISLVRHLLSSLKSSAYDSIFIIIISQITKQNRVFF